LKAQGYDWDVLLATRGWWTLDNETRYSISVNALDLPENEIKEYFPLLDEC
jgi:hypothetical protein